MVLFPHIIARIGGNTYDDLIFEQYPALSKLCSEYQTQKKNTTDRIEALSAMLLIYNQQVTDRKIQNKIQNFRRDIYNRRRSKIEQIAILFTVLPENIINEIQKHFNDLELEQTLKIKWEELYEQLMLCTRKTIKKLARSEFIQNGLILSSEDLYNSTQLYLENENNIDLHLELSLFKYITRSCCKTTPFSTFNNLICAGLREDTVGLISFKINSDPFKINSHIRLNNYIFKYLKELLFSVQDFQWHLQLSINPTIISQNNFYSFITNHNNVESFQRISIDQINTEIFLYFKANKNVTLRILVDLVKELTSATETEIVTYLKKLVNFGFLEYWIPVSGIDPEWDMKFSTYLIQNFQNKYLCLKNAAETLINLRLLIKKYELENSISRKQILRECYSILVSAIKEIHEFANLPFKDTRTPREKLAPSNTTGKMEANIHQPFQHTYSLVFYLKPNQLLYEDSVADVNASINKSELNIFIEKLDRLIFNYKLPDLKVVENAKLRDFFLESYHKSSVVPLLNFHEEHSKYRKSANQKDSENIDNLETQKNPQKTNLSFETLTQSWQQNFSTSVASLDTTLDSIGLNDTHFPKVSANQMKRGSYSKAAFIQFFHRTVDDGSLKLMGVVNSHFQGFGKLISRFLHLFKTSLTEDLQILNDTVATFENVIFAENSDASFFNANIHPIILQHQINAPGSNNIVELENSIKVSDLIVRYSTELDQLYLMHSISGKVVNVLDLGLQTVTGRSQLYQLLNHFNEVDQVALYSLMQAINRFQKNDPIAGSEMIFYPQIIFEDQLIIQRKNWRVPRNLIPTKGKGQRDFDFYSAFNMWRKSHKMPDEVFVRIKYAKNNKPANRDNKKPQYIHFLNPFCIKNLEKICSQEFEEIMIEEMVPNSTELLHINNRKFVSEYVVQWYKTNR